MRTGFTIVEVVIATVIATIAGVGLLQMNSNYTHIFNRISEKALSSELVSVLGLHADIKYNHTSKTLEDILNGTYEIKNDDFRHLLKDVTVDYTEHLVETITFGEEELGGEFGDYSMNKNTETSTMAPVIQFELLEVHMQNKTLSGSVLFVRPIE